MIKYSFFSATALRLGTGMQFSFKWVYLDSIFPGHKQTKIDPTCCG